MMTTIRTQMLVPVPLLLMNALGALMMAAGVMGLTAPEIVPALARPAVAYALIGVGLTIDIAAVVAILKITAKTGRGWSAAQGNSAKREFP